MLSVREEQPVQHARVAQLKIPAAVNILTSVLVIILLEHCVVTKTFALASIPFLIAIVVASCEPLQVSVPGPEYIDEFLTQNNLDRSDVLEESPQEDGSVLLTIRSATTDIISTVIISGLQSGATNPTPIGVGGAAAGALIGVILSRVSLQRRIKKGEVILVKKGGADV